MKFWGSNIKCIIIEWHLLIDTYPDTHNKDLNPGDLVLHKKPFLRDVRMNSSTFLFAHVSLVVLPCRDCYITLGCESLKQPLALVKGSARFQSHLFQQHRANSVSCSLNPLTIVHCLPDSHAYRLPQQYTMATCILKSGIVSSYLVYNQESAKTKHAEFGCIFSNPWNLRYTKYAGKSNE